jgi:Cft2 family RNA processing exonuclease
LDGIALTNESEIKISFLGGASEIGASSALIEVGDTRLLIDCGVRFNSESPLPDLSSLHGKAVDAIAVTHAHSDHTGGLPVVCQAYPHLPIYATPPTRDIAMILLGDALKLMGMEDREGEVPLYAGKQVAHVGEAFVPVHHGESVTVGEVTVTFLPAGHILGASMLHLATPAGHVLFTGDYSVSAGLTVPALTRPHLPVDMLVTEATYGERLHEDRDAAETRLVTRVREVVEGGGRVLIPAFAVGRAQEILLILKRALRNHALPEVPVFVDGMVRAVSNAYGRNEKYVSRMLFHEIRKAVHPFYTNGIAPVENPEARKAVLEKGPCVVVASSGMLSGGASSFYASELLANSKDAILITGYQDEESPGRALLSLAETEGAREMKLAGRVVPVSCQLEKYGLSAHADRMQMVGLIESLRPRTVVMVHGSVEAKRALADGLSTGDAVMAENGQTVTRRYPVRRTRERSGPVARRLDLASGRNLLGPPTGTPIPGRRVAEAWYGGKPSAEEVDRLAQDLETLGLVRRDDHRRQMLHVLSPKETDRFPAEAALEEELKRENPKGKLLELSMRQRIEPPDVTHGVEGAFHTATMTMSLGGVPLESGIQRAATKRTAEQLAARALLRMIDKGKGAVAVVRVTEEEASALKTQNPKGRLLEWCMLRKAPAPRFEDRAVVDGFHAEVALTLEGETIRSGWHAAGTKKMAEQAASKALLAMLEETSGSSESPPREMPPDKSVARAPSSQATPGGRDPMMLLNEMRQLQVIGDFGYDLKACTGPSHQPLFTIVGWATLESGERVEAPPVQSAAKKAGRRQAAEALVAELREMGALAGDAYLPRR